MECGRAVVCVRWLVAVVFAGALLSLSRSAYAQATDEAPPGQLAPAGEAEEDSTTPPIDFDGTERHEWWALAPNLKLRLHNDAGGDALLRDWPEHLVEGTRTTSGVFELSRRFGPVTLYAGAGVGVTTTRSGGPADLTFVERRQAAASVATVGLQLRLPQRWTLHLGASTLTTTTGTEVRVGVTAEKKF